MERPRGLCLHCLEGNGQEEGGQVSVDVTTETVIDRPLAIVASYAADPSHAPEWYDDIAQ